MLVVNFGLQATVCRQLAFSLKPWVMINNPQRWNKLQPAA